jgi:5'-3' exonuclease
LGIKHISEFYYRKNRKIYNPIKKEFITIDVFKERFGGLEPINYRIIKSITGCSSDNIQGIHGIGEKTVVKYLKAEINNSEKFKEIQAQRTLIDFNEKYGRTYKNITNLKLKIKTLPEKAYDVKIAATSALSLVNLKDAINAG